MRKLILSVVAAATIASPVAMATAANASGAPVTQDTTVMVPTTDAKIDLPALNSQFTSETLSITGGNSYFGPNADQITWYLANGTFGSTDYDGHWTSGHEYGNLRVEGAPAGSVIYSLDGGSHWAALKSTQTFTNKDAKQVTLGYNDVPGLFGDNTGTGFVINVHRVKG